MGTFITISRKWNNPKIEINIATDSIELKMDIEDFKKALLEEIGSVKFVFRQNTFEKVVDDAFEEVLAEIKKESSKVIK